MLAESVSKTLAVKWLKYQHSKNLDQCKWICIARKKFNLTDPTVTGINSECKDIVKLNKDT